MELVEFRPGTGTKARGGIGSSDFGLHFGIETWEGRTIRRQELGTGSGSEEWQEGKSRYTRKVRPRSDGAPQWQTWIQQAWGRTLELAEDTSGTGLDGGRLRQ